MIAVKSMNTFFLDSLVQERFFHKNHGFKILSVVIKIQLELIIVLNLKRIKCLSQPFHVSGWQTITQEANPVLWRKFYCCYSPTYPTQNIFFVRSFVFFVFVFWSTKTTAANLQYLAYLTPSKSINQVTLNNEHRNYLYWAQFDLFYYHINL